MLRFEPVGLPETHVGFTSVADGNLALHVGDDAADVAERRGDLEARLGVDPGALRFMDQVHSADVHLVSTGGSLRLASHRASAPTADALVSADGSAPLAVMVADCVPVVLAGAVDGGVATAVAHAGRAGLLGGVLQNTVRALRDAGAGAIQAWIGPSVCGRCYEVPPDMAAGAEAILPGIATTTRRGTRGLDLPGAARGLLASEGVAVVETGICTLEDTNYYSYRRDPATGRFAGLVWVGTADTPERSGAQ